MNREPVATSPNAVDASAYFSAKPRVEISRTSKGDRTWRVSVVAQEDTPESIREAHALAVEIDADLAQRFGR